MAGNDRTLQRLLKLRKEEEQQALKIWQDALAQIARFEEQLQTLTTYRTQYVSEFAEKGTAGMGASALISFHNFLDKMDAVIERQLNDLRGLRERAGSLENAYLTRQKERKIIETLLEKHRLAALKKERKAEAKLNDEFAMVALQRRRHSSP